MYQLGAFLAFALEAYVGPACLEIFKVAAG
jgi:hypothetical protein